MCVLALFIALLQSRSGVSELLSDDRVVDGMTVVVVVVTLAGLGLGLLSLTGRVGLGFALAAVAGAAPIWLLSLLNALGVADGENLQNVDEATRWIGAAVLVAALVAVGVRPPVRLVAWVGVVLLAWLIAPTITASAYAEVLIRPGMGLREAWGDNLSATLDVWRQSASLDMRPLTPWFVAIVVAAIVSLWIDARSRMSANAEEPPVTS